ncbi:MAG: hypothetical protein JXA98_02260 [Methanosarcinaceae archaeon]|nr:hypothetical protein [Methanosarcinaceae archaeon]
MSPINKIHIWHARASDEDYVSKFIFEYLAFISYLMNHMPLDKEVNDKERKTDRTVIQNLKRNEHIKNEYLRMVDNGVNFEAVPVEKEWFEATTKNSQWMELNTVSNGLLSSWHTITTILNDAHNQQHALFDRPKYWNCSTHGSKCKDGSKTIIRNKKDWVNMVEFWYSLRNNLLHGIIDPENDEYGLLIKNGYITLKPLVELLIYRLDMKEHC